VDVPSIEIFEPLLAYRCCASTPEEANTIASAKMLTIVLRVDLRFMIFSVLLLF